jgi:hypothetical protein
VREIDARSLVQKKKKGAAEAGPYIGERRGWRSLRLCSRGGRPGFLELDFARGNDLAFNDSLDCSLTEPMPKRKWVCDCWRLVGKTHPAAREKGAGSDRPPVYVPLPLCALKEANGESSASLLVSTRVVEKSCGGRQGSKPGTMTAKGAAESGQVRPVEKENVPP